MTTASNLMGLAQWTSIVAPTLYTGITVQHSSIGLQPIIDNAPPKLLAKIWLQIYRQGPSWVQPLVQLSLLSNGFLAWNSPSGSVKQALYLVSAAAMLSTLLITFAHFEPGINGACKWKVDQMLGSEDAKYRMPDRQRAIRPSTVAHSATQSTKQWAEKKTIEELVTIWGRKNHLRWAIGFSGAVASGFATLYY